MIVTGGTGALGQAVVGELLGAGWGVVATWVVEAERDRAREAHGGNERLDLVAADLSSEGGTGGALEAAGPELRAVVNLVGGFAAGGRCHECPPDELAQMLELNLMTAYRMTRAALPALLAGGGGSLVYVGTKAALEPFPGGGAYAVSKSAVLTLVRSLAVEYREEGIRANAVVPNVLDTPANREQMPDADHSTWVPPTEVARVISFLCSDDSAPVSGAAIPVYGRAG